MKYSKKEITKAGNIILTSKSKEEINQALLKINDWRTNHLQPLKVMKRSLMKILTEKGIEPYLISQRLKRLTSIEYKLDLNPSMGLGGMQDIGGYRAVLKDVKDLKKTKRLLESVLSKHKLEKTNNYIQTPKSSGYRSVHLIYKYHSDVEKYDSLKVELQIRTKLQHYWATAVETAGIITKTSLKSSQGPDEWLDFFRIISSLFAIKEGLPVLDIHKEKTKEELMVDCYKYCNELKIIETLKALRITTKHLEKKNFKGDYYLIHIDIENQNINIQTFKKSRFNMATHEYLQIEKQIDNKKHAVVLVSANSFKSLKQAYPSYFLDTSEFLITLEKINKDCINKGYVHK